MGGSIALALKKYCSDFSIYGFDINKDHLNYAHENGMLDAELSNENCQMMDIIFIATPVTTVTKVLKNYYPFIKNTEVLITDIGSTKSYICHKVQEEFPELNFIGGHPMTGREVSGPEGALADLFLDKNYILMKNHQGGNRGKVKKLEEIINKIGARIIYLTPEEHDRLVSFTSHLPQFLATAIINELISLEKEQPGIDRLVGQGFLDFTRIAASDPRMWTDIFTTNKDNIIQMVDDLIDRLNEFREMITQEEQQKIHRFIQRGKERRLLLDREKREVE